VTAPVTDKVGAGEGGGCTNCGNKGGCDHRKGAMFAAIDEALQRLYPTHRLDERREPSDFLGEVATDVGGASAARLAQRLSARLGTLVLEVPPNPEEYCRHIYVLCLGRSPSLIELLHGQAPATAFESAGPDGLEELYLRVSISDLAPFAAVQQVRLRGDLLPGSAAEGAFPEALIIEETARAGVFDPVLLPRYQRLVATLVEEGLRNLDFGEINEPPAGFDPGDHAQRHGSDPVVANYLFYPQPCSSITTTVVPFSSHVNQDDALAGAAAGVI
jgi:hypothetical protein